MTSRRVLSLALILGGMLVVLFAYLFGRVPQVSAQCGTQMSSCKNCHEVQKEKPVNQDGTGWHQSHAFGDFCANCHAGNVQSMVKEEAHKGMVPPLSDVQASCASCHPNDLMDRAQVYATKLGVEVGTGGTAPSAGEPAAPAEAEQVQEQPPEMAVAEAPAMANTSAGNVVDYNQRYAESQGAIMLNWGNVILVVLILGMLVGGGAFVFWNERRLHRAAVPPAQPVKTKTAAVMDVKDYPPEVLALLPALSRLNPAGRRALQRLLEHPEEASELLYSLSQLDPELLRRIRNLDERARALLVALAGGSCN